MDKPNRNKLVDVEKIRAICLDRGIPFAELGRRIGLESRESISRRLQNKHSVTGDELFMISDELGVPVSELRTAEAV